MHRAAAHAQSGGRGPAHAQRSAGQHMHRGARASTCTEERGPAHAQSAHARFCSQRTCGTHGAKHGLKPGRVLERAPHTCAHTYVRAQSVCATSRQGLAQPAPVRRHKLVHFCYYHAHLCEHTQSSHTKNTTPLLPAQHVHWNVPVPARQKRPPSHPTQCMGAWTGHSVRVGGTVTGTSDQVRRQSGRGSRRARVWCRTRPSAACAADSHWEHLT